MSVNIRVNPRNLSNVPANPTYGFKIPIRYIRRIARVDPGLQQHLAILAGGAMNTYQREISIVWPQRNAPQFQGHISYTYTGPQLSSGGYSSQAHITITHSVWTPWIVNMLGGSSHAVYFEGNSGDLVVIDAP